MFRVCLFLNIKFLTNGTRAEKFFKIVNFTDEKVVCNRLYSLRNCSSEHVSNRFRFLHSKNDTEVSDDNFESDFVRRSSFFSTPEEDKECSINLRNQLHANSKDRLTNLLKECSSEEEVFSLLQKNHSVLNAEHLSQAILVLRDIEVNSGSLSSNVWIRPNAFRLRSKHSKMIEVKEDFTTSLTLKNPSFSALLTKINELRCEFSADALASTVLYLQKLRVPLTHLTQLSLLSQLDKLIDSSDFGHLPLSVLSKYATIIREHYHSWSSLYLEHLAETRVRKSIDLCVDLNDLKYICIFYHACNTLVTDSVLENIKSKIISLLDLVPSTSPNIVLRIMFFLHLRQWREKNFGIFLQLLNSLKEREELLYPKQLLNLTEIFPGNCEPHSFNFLLSRHFSSLNGLEDSQNNIGIYFLKSVASNYSMESQHHLQRELVKSLSSPVTGQENMYYLTILYSMIQNLKSVDWKVYRSYWTRVLNILNTTSNEGRTLNKLMFFSNRYIIFNSKNTKFHHHEFELQMAHWLLQELKASTGLLSSSIFARVVVFLLTYGRFRDLDFLDGLLNKLLSVIPQLSLTDCLVVSAGLFTAMELNRKQPLYPEFLRHFVQLSGALNQRALDYLRMNPTVSPRHLGLLCQAYQFRHCVIDSELFVGIIDRYKCLKVEDMSSLTVIEVRRFLTQVDYYVPELLETLAEFVVKYNKDLKANIAETVLKICFHFGYTPQCEESFFPIAVELINRDKQNLRCLHLIRAALSLGYFYQLPQSLIQSIFNVQFLEKVDEEIKLGFIKVAYPKLARNSLMDLNRIVCLDYPQHDIPWFHARYCKDLNSLESGRRTPFQDDVQDVLVYLLGNRNLFHCNVISPYNYKIDFEIFLDRNEMPIEPKLVKNPAAYFRIAVLLLKKSATSHPSDELKGYEQLRQRHLALMGYHVISVSPTLWNTMFMSEKSTKADYLSQQIWPKRYS